MNQTPKLVGSKEPLKNKNQNELMNGSMFGKQVRPQKQISQDQPQKASNNPLRLLVGKLVFLDIHNSYKMLNKVKECMNLIDAKIADCLSKDVNYVITNREKNIDGFQSPEVPDHAKKIRTSPNTLNFLSRSTSLINRTQAILEKASKGSTSTDILATARRLGISIMNLTELDKYIEKLTNKKRSLEVGDKVGISKDCEDKSGLKKDSGLTQCLTKTPSHKIYKLKNNFIKFESICKQYKPIYQEFDYWHELNFDAMQTKFTNSPFQHYFSDDNGSSNCSSTQNDRKNRQSESSLNQPQSCEKNKFKSPNSSKLNLKQNESVVAVNRLQLNRASSFSTSLRTQSNVQQNLAKKKSTGYCECCKQRYENLKQHLTSAQHDTFERNQANFKEIDIYINGILNFKKFLITNDLLAEESGEENKEQNCCDMDEMRQFARNFVEKKSSLGISKNQIKEALNAEFKDPILTETAISKFERLDITPRSSAKVRPVLEKLINDSKLKFGDRFKSFSEVDSKKKRKRDCTFSPNALNILNEKFDKNPSPNDAELFMLANHINYDEDMIKNWFNEKHQMTKPNFSVKKFKKTNVVNTLNLLENDSSLQESISNSSDDHEKLIFEAKQMTPKKNPKDQGQHKKTPPFISSFSMSSPSAAALFGLNTHNSFNISTDIPINGPLNASNHNSSATTKLLASKVDLMSGSTELQTIKPTDAKNSACSANLSKSDNSTDLSCIDDIVLAAFVNDFSYEIVNK
ncbi:POU class transcription factor 1 isoform X4 [Brachionus plicatilis]|uniref:POU class transcription factor 1 isoform X4 n=1 Tax=Brachionus plicatilis TaxID=10195 RepID=A0A3M7Q5Y5_BRAPC|nr:POU class transcription factor 1 isoform X4 [Brachionus plicatilis]